MANDEVNCFLDVRGRLVDVVWQKQLAPERWVLMSAHEIPEKLLAWLNQFWFTENIQIKALTENPGVDISKWRSTGEAERIAQKLPRAPTEISESFNPLEIGLESTIAANKGCYPGQEAIERLRAQGKATKMLAALVCRAEDFEVLCQAPEITSHLEKWAEGRAVALAVIKKTALTGGGLFTTSTGVPAWVVSSAR